jgi:hypothetical protein
LGQLIRIPGNLSRSVYLSGAHQGPDVRSNAGRYGPFILLWHSQRGPRESAHLDRARGSCDRGGNVHRRLCTPGRQDHSDAATRANSATDLSRWRG